MEYEYIITLSNSQVDPDRRIIRMTETIDGRTTNVWEQIYPVNEGRQRRADELAIRRFGQLIRQQGDPP